MGNRGMGRGVAGALAAPCGWRAAIAAGWRCFDRSLDGFWRSFRAAAITYPLYLVLLTMRVSVAQWQRSGGWRIVIVETIGYVIAWVAFPLLDAGGDALARPRRTGSSTSWSPYNWCQVPQTRALRAGRHLDRERDPAALVAATSTIARRHRRPGLRVVHRPGRARYELLRRSGSSSCVDLRPRAC